jgi:hypothetical protein
VAGAYSKVVRALQHDAADSILPGSCEALAVQFSQLRCWPPIAGEGEQFLGGEQQLMSVDQNHG